MAREPLTVVAINRAGVVATPAAGIADGHSFFNDGQTFLSVTNVGASQRALTVKVPRVVDGQAVADLVVPLAAGVTRLIGPFPRATFSQPGGAVHLDYPAGNEVDLEVEVYRLGS